LLLTHWHGDHINAVDEIVEKTGAKITAGINEIPYLQINNKMFEQMMMILSVSVTITTIKCQNK
jgi:phosphoribosyl 1,2-cyclic phosphodiesterase